MGKKHLLPQGNEEFLERLGFTETDIKVYIATLDGGLVSLGEIQQLTDINDLGRILESVRDLIDIGLVKKAKGTMRRYYATLPFFRETLSIEREFKFALEAMIQSLNKSKEETTQNRERIVAIQFPKIVDNLLDRYYKEILAPVLDDLEEIRNDIESNAMDFVKEVSAENSGIKEEIQLMLKPLKNHANLLNQKFDLGLTNEKGELTQYIVNRKQARLNLLQDAHKAIGKHLQALKQEIDNLVAELRSMHSSIREEVTKLQDTLQEMTTQITSFQEAASQIGNAKKELQAELVVAREQVKRVLSSPEEENPSAKVDEIFTSLTNKIKNVELSDENMTGILQQAQTGISGNAQTLDTVATSLDQTITAIQERLTSSFDELKSNMTTIFNSLNDTDEDSLQTLKSAVEDKMHHLEENIKKEGETVKNKLNAHIESIESRQEKTFNHYEEKMASLYNRPVDRISPFLNQWLDDIEPIIDEFKAKSDEALNDILDPIQQLEEGTFSTLTERIGFVKAMIEGRSDDIQQVLEAAKEFDFTKAADTSVVVGLPAIYASLTDLLLRTKSKVTVVTPHMDLELMEVARTLKSTVRITFVTDVDPDKDARIIKKLEDIGRINLRKYPDRDLYACIRDSEEIVFGYIRDGEETIGIRTSTPSIVELLSDRLNETVIRNSKPI